MTLIQSLNLSRDGIQQVLSHASFARPERYTQYTVPALKLPKTKLFSDFGLAHKSKLPHFDALPNEIVAKIICQLDLRSAVRLSQAGRYSRALVTSVPEIRRLGTCAQQYIYMLRACGLSCAVTVQELHSALINKLCSLCGDFGPIVSLLTTQRYCQNCMQTADHISPISLRSILDNTSLSTSQVEKRVRLMGVDMRFPQWHCKLFFNPSTIMVARPDAQVLLEEAGTWEKVRRRDDRCYRYMSAMMLPWSNMKDGTVESGLGCRGCQPPRCRVSDWGSQNRTYSRAGFEQHFYICQGAQDYVKSVREALEDAES